MDGGETVNTLYKKYMKHGIILLKENIQNLIEGILKSTQQTAANSTYFSKKRINYHNIQIDLEVTAYQLDAQIKAFTFRTYQMVTLFSYKINRCIITNTISICAPGKILSEDEYSITLSTIDFNIILYKNKFSEFIDECRNNNINVVKRIFDSIYLEEKTIEEWTPLIVDCYNNSIESAAFLLKMEADANAFNKNGTTVLMYAKDAILKHNQYDILVLILKYKPNIYIKNFYGRDIFYYLKDQPNEIINFIKNHHD